MTGAVGDLDRIGTHQTPVADKGQKGHDRSDIFHGSCFYTTGYCVSDHGGDTDHSSI